MQQITSTLDLLRRRQTFVNSKTANLKLSLKKEKMGKKERVKRAYLNYVSPSSKITLELLKAYKEKRKKWAER